MQQILYFNSKNYSIFVLKNFLTKANTLHPLASVQLEQPWKTSKQDTKNFKWLLLTQQVFQNENYTYVIFLKSVHIAPGT